MGQSSLSLLWDRAVLYGTEQSHMGHIPLVLDRAVSCGTFQTFRSKQSHMGSLKQHLVPSVTFLKFGKSLECLASLIIFFYDFLKSPGLPEGPR